MNYKIDMNSLEELLRPLVEKAISGIEKGVDFTMEQAPLLVREFYNWHIAEAIFWLVLSVIVLSIPYFMYKIYKKYDAFREDELMVFFPIMASIISLVFGVIMFISNLLDLIKLIVAPRLYLIEYFLN